ncbi:MULTISPECIES: heavy-metal-associated domain-containing protein [unclassified Gilliamella]|uniref:heavy-metal-associated domain-containing protein n=1 Tax=unclassified Gilliamella TaxID=2685620 RepID=UPI00226AFBDD|nr:MULTISPECIES: heavy-metal-associated domain-containing protein [unclassified Gilliamella]MCX8596331.1 heavy-metal-associated domain-containing protein [Gilliamella sp. B3493]MCX8598698.1 heavy-metal-associated domain-containing protein [Gilliamella sp. B3486]MCX8689294.1 heavy-metal-associated domain-containing protein [Gilliamella sp. B2973]MCX8704996.1 heavy-metal-associated domain-containing protein [Gilliamella sp. B3127]
MMKLIVDNMSCQHCVKTITKAINDIDPKAKVTVDLAKHEVDIEGGTISQEAAIQAVDQAGFEFVGISY